MNIRNLVVVAVLAANRIASGQATDGPPNFDLLKAAHGADSLRRLTVKQQAEMVRLTRAAAAWADTIAVQRREIALLRAASVPRSTQTTSAPSISMTTTPASAHATASAASPALAPAVAPASATTPAAAPVAAAVAVSGPAPSTVPVAAPATPPVAAPASTPAPAPVRITPLPAPVLSGLVQVWLSGGNNGYHNTYRLRRAEVKASGFAAPSVTWVVMLDVAKALSASSVTMPNGSLQTTVSQGSRALQDATIMVQASPALRIDVGQQKLPFGLEGSQSSATLETVERALFASDRGRGGSFGDVRDIGVALRGRVATSVDYAVGTFNGSGESQNDVDVNTAKALVARLVVRPLEGLQLGASGIYGGTSAADAPRRDRDGVDVRFRSNKLLIQMEGVAGHDAGLSRRGLYVHTGYHVQPMVDIHLRFDAWDPDIAREADAASATERDYLAGFTWSVPGTALKAQSDLVRRTWSSNLSPNRWQLSMNLQTTW
jgi:hypothetical protein